MVRQKEIQEFLENSNFLLNMDKIYEASGHKNYQQNVNLSILKMKMFQLTKEITTEKVFKSCVSTKEFVLGMLAVTTAIAEEHLNPGAIMCCLDLIKSFFKQFSYLKNEF